MPFVITSPCVGVKDGSCVAVCPVDCIHEAEDQFYIVAEECIDCGLCVPECPVDAIFDEALLTDDLKAAVARNLELSAGGAVDGAAASR